MRTPILALLGLVNYTAEALCAHRNLPMLGNVAVLTTSLSGALFCMLPILFVNLSCAVATNTDLTPFELQDMMAKSKLEVSFRQLFDLDSFGQCVVDP